MKKKKFQKSRTDRSIWGVCGGIGEYFGISSFLIRVLFLVFLPFGFLLYIVLANTMPESSKKLY